MAYRPSNFYRKKFTLSIELYVLHLKSYNEDHAESEWSQWYCIVCRYWYPFTSPLEMMKQDQDLVSSIRMNYKVFFSRLSRSIAPNKLGWLSLLLGLAGTIHGPIPYLHLDWLNWLWDFHQEVSPELVGIGITVLIIDWANARRELERLKAQLLRELSAEDNDLVLRAIDSLRANGWLDDGSLNDIKLIGANLNKGKLDGAKMKRANLRQAILSNGRLRDVDLDQSTLFRARLDGAVLIGSVLTNSNMINASLIKAKLNGANLSFARLLNANFEKASLVNTNLTKAKCRNSNFSQADMTGSICVDADMSGCNFSSTVFIGSNLRNCVLRGAILDNAIFAPRKLVIASMSQHLALPLSIKLHAPGLKQSATDLIPTDTPGEYISPVVLEDAILDEASLINAEIDFEILASAKSLKGVLMQPGKYFEEWLPEQASEIRKLFTKHHTILEVQSDSSLVIDKTNNIVSVSEALTITTLSRSMIYRLCKDKRIMARKEGASKHLDQWHINRQSLLEYAKHHNKLRQ